MLSFSLARLRYRYNGNGCCLGPFSFCRQRGSGGAACLTGPFCCRLRMLSAGSRKLLPFGEIAVKAFPNICVPAALHVHTAPSTSRATVILCYRREILSLVPFCVGFGGTHFCSPDSQIQIPYLFTTVLSVFCVSFPCVSSLPKRDSRTFLYFP